MLGDEKYMPLTPCTFVQAMNKMNYVQLIIKKNSINFHYLTALWMSSEKNQGCLQGV
jgi:hypothetical protein